MPLVPATFASAHYRLDKPLLSLGPTILAAPNLTRRAISNFVWLLPFVGRLLRVQWTVASTEEVQMASRRFAGAAFAAVLVSLFPTVSFAQSAITGLVTDATGGVLPGVTVEAASPALIEQTRTAVSDGSGRYRIEDLRPGTYKVTFTLPGFSTFVREGVVLESEFVASVNAQLRVGTLEETVTVSGAPPVVDLQSTQSRTVLNREQVEALPTGRSFQSIAATIPAVGTALAGRFDVGGGTQMWQGTIIAYGGLSSDFAVQVDGMNVSMGIRTG